MSRDPTTQMLKDCTETMVLKLLAERPMYGYELVQELTRRSRGAFELGQGTVYPLLYSLERKGLIEAAWITPDDGGRRRKDYSLTKSGRAAMRQRIDAWKSFVRGVSSVLEVRLAPGG